MADREEICPDRDSSGYDFGRANPSPVATEWVLVPSEPTEEMVLAGMKALDSVKWNCSGTHPIDGWSAFPAAIWPAMLATAPRDEGRGELDKCTPLFWTTNLGGKRVEKLGVVVQKETLFRLIEENNSIREQIKALEAELETEDV